MEYFSDAGNEVHIISFKYSKIDNCKLYVLNTFGLGKLGYFIGIISIIKTAKKINPNIVHAHYVTSYGFLAAVCKLKPLILTAWGSDILISSKKSWILRKFIVFAIRHSELVTVVASHMREAILNLGVEPTKILHTPFGINTKTFKKIEISKLKNNVINIISTRSLNTLYDQKTLIAAMAILKERGYEFFLNIIGDGPLFENLKELTVQLELAENVSFLGFLDQNDLIDKLGHSNIYVSTAISDGDSSSLLEAMACGCFPVATRIPANLYWIKDRQNGLLFSPGDSEGLAKCLEEVFVGRYDLMDISISNRQLIVDKADNKKCYEFIGSIYSKLNFSIKL